MNTTLFLISLTLFDFIDFILLNLFDFIDSRRFIDFN